MIYAGAHAAAQVNQSIQTPIVWLLQDPPLQFPHQVGQLLLREQEVETLMQQQVMEVMQLLQVLDQEWELLQPVAMVAPQAALQPAQLKYKE